VLRKRRDEWGYAESEKAWLRSIRDADGVSSLVVVANEKDEVVAVASSTVTGARRAEVGALYVRVAHQRSGIGRKLLETILDHYRDIGISLLHVAVLSANRPAREFYERLGGTVSGTRLHPDGPEVVYTWDLVGIEAY
jgi:GNAT superfamily N-acetyltransferase